jgi:hypothetical protein
MGHPLKSTPNVFTNSGRLFRSEFPFYEVGQRLGLVNSCSNILPVRRLGWEQIAHSQLPIMEARHKSLKERFR